MDFRAAPRRRPARPPAWLIVSFAAIAVAITLSADGSRADDAPKALAERTLTREADRIVASGANLRALHGTKIDKVRAFAWRDGGMKQIPFQIDERHPDGSYVWQHGEGSKKQDVDRGAIDRNDELCFMVKDSGAQVGHDAWPSGAKDGVEVEVRDPRSGDKAWIYLIAFDSPPAALDTDYVDITIHDDGKTDFRGDGWYADNDKSPSSSFRTTNFYFDGGKNFVDATQIRVIVNYLFVTVARGTEDVRVKVKSWIDGPVRVVTLNSAEVHLIWGFYVSSSDSMCIVWSNGSELPMTVDCPVNIDSGDDEPSYYSLYLDLKPGVGGLKFFNDKNLEPMPIDGKMGKAERRLNRAYPSWNVVYGDEGAIVTRMLLYDKVVRDQPRNKLVYLDDDKADPDPPEYYEGRRGAAGFQVDLTGLTTGGYKGRYILHYIPGYEKGDEAEFVAIHDEPLRVVGR